MTGPSAGDAGDPGDPGRVVEPDVIEGDLGFRMRDLEIYEVSFEMSGSRVRGDLSYWEGIGTFFWDPVPAPTG